MKFDEVEIGIIKFLKKMKEQNNRSTASPYFYVIRSSKLIITDPDYYSDEVKYYHSDYDNLTWNTEEEFIEYLRHDLSEAPYSEAYIELEVEKLKKLYFIKTWEEHGMFLTEEDAENHLKSNNYHYSHDAHTYVKHAWRAPELQKFLDNLMNYFGIKDNN
jgi:hypothetical protein